MDKTQQCCERVHKAGDSWHMHQCARRGVVEHDGKLYCKQHDPKAVAARRAESHARWEANWNAQREAREAAEAMPATIATLRDKLAEAERRLRECLRLAEGGEMAAEFEGNGDYIEIQRMINAYFAGVQHE